MVQRSEEPDTLGGFAPTEDADKGERASAHIEHLKKVDMAEAAQDLLAGSGWLPEPLRTPGRTPASATDEVDTPSIVETETDLAAHAMAAE